LAQAGDRLRILSAVDAGRATRGELGTLMAPLDGGDAYVGELLDAFTADLLAEFDTNKGAIQ